MIVQGRFNQFKTTLNRALDVPTADADDARRRKLLNIVLVGMGVFSFLILVNSILVWLLPAEVSGATPEEIFILFAGSLVLLIGIGIIYAVNRLYSRQAAGWMLLLLLLAAISTTDTPEELVNGRSLFVYTIPILMASVFLNPASSFSVATLGCIIITILSEQSNQPLNTTAMVIFFVIAWVSWLSARSLQRALEDLRAINHELDQRVAQRTSELRTALEQVQTESSKNQAILTSIADGVIMLEQDSQVMAVNPATTELLKLPSMEVIGQDITQLIRSNPDPAERQALLDLVKEAHSLQGNPKIEWQGKTLSVSFAPVPDAVGKARGLVAVFRNFTREAELERMKDRFVSMASHELRTPLNAILGYADMLQVGVYEPLNDAQGNIISRVMANTKRMLSLVNNLLDQAQIAAGELTIHNAPLEIDDLLSEVSSIMSVLAESKKLRFETCVEQPFPAVLMGDQQRLSQILINLTGNAIKFTEQGEVVIKVFRRDAKHWALQVRDTGRGIPKEAHASIFEAFQQVDDPIIRKTEGTGLGLSIVKQLTRIMEGTILLDSEIGKGSTFTITLPLEEVV